MIGWLKGLFGGGGEDIGPQEAVRRINQGALLVDVREPDEFDQGALTAFQVVTGEGLNTPNDVDNGRFLIALKVAPSVPIEFITVALLRSGEGLLQVLEV